MNFRRWCGRGLVWAAAGIILAGGQLRSVREPQADPFELFRPWIVISDSDRERLDGGDVLVRILPGDCALKLAANELTALRRVVDAAGPAWKEAAQQEFRRLVVARVNLYRTEGLAGLPPYADRSDPVRPQDAFTTLIASSPYLSSRLPEFAARLEQYPHVDRSSVESFFYWSKEQYGTGKRVVSVTHVDILRPDADASVPDVVVTGKQIFATQV